MGGDVLAFGSDVRGDIEFEFGARDGLGEIVGAIEEGREPEKIILVTHGPVKVDSTARGNFIVGCIMTARGLRLPEQTLDPLDSLFEIR